MDADAGLDAGADEERLKVEVAAAQVADGAVERRHHRADDDAGDLGGVDASQLQQFACLDAVAVDGLLVDGHQPPVGH